MTRQHADGIRVFTQGMDVWDVVRLQLVVLGQLAAVSHLVMSSSRLTAISVSSLSLDVGFNTVDIRHLARP